METELSIVIPVYNSAPSLCLLYKEVSKVLEEVGNKYELILVDDGSRDDSFKIMQQLQGSDERVKIIQLARNFGQQNAIMCGLRNAQGTYLITMDDDLQHPPQEIPRLFAEVLEGYDIVYGVPREKKHPFYRSLGTLFTDLFFNVFFKKDRRIKISSFRIMSRDIVEKIIEDRTSFIYISAIAFKHTQNIASIPVGHLQRLQGKSNYNFLKLIKLYLKLIFHYSEFSRFLFNYKKPQYIIKNLHGKESFNENIDFRSK